MPSGFEREAWGMQPGAAARVFDTALGRIGILIGYDAEFPLPARVSEHEIVIRGSCEACLRS
mgnify:CR=1 FL=1